MIHTIIMIRYCFLFLTIFFLTAFVPLGHGDELDAVRQMLNQSSENQSATQFDADAFDQEVGKLFMSLVTDFDQAANDQPYDVIGHIKKCDFISNALIEYEYSDWIEPLYDQAEACDQELEERFPYHPEIELRKIDNLWGEDKIKEAENLLNSINRFRWNNAQLARLYTSLAVAYQDVNLEQAFRYGNEALNLDELSPVRIIVAEQLFNTGNSNQALEILTPEIAQADEKDYWSVLHIMNLLTVHGMRDDIMNLYETLATKEYYPHLETAEVLSRAGLYDAASKEYDLAIAQSTYSSADEFQKFYFAFTHGTGEQAWEAYNQLRDIGWDQDPFGLNRIALLVRDPTLPWRVRDVLSVLCFLVGITLVALLALLPLALIHYRGLALYKAGKQPVYERTWDLKHAWYALFAFGLTTTLSIVLNGPISFSEEFFTLFDYDIDFTQFAPLIILESFIFIILLLPLANKARFKQTLWVSKGSKLYVAILTGVLCGLLLRIPLLIVASSAPESLQNLFSKDELLQIVSAVRSEFGFAAAFWILSIAAPVTEEFVFRGILLKSFQKNIGFAWANIAQAALFSLLHFNLVGSIMLFIVGLLAGFITKKTGGLLAAIVMHSVFNGLLVFYMF